MQGYSYKGTKKRASTPKYVSNNQLTLIGFETPFEQRLTKENRWVKMAQQIPWDKIVTKYDQQFTATEGRPPISGRVVIGAIMIKHLGNLSDRETILQIQENMFMQYFLGYSSFTNEAPFSASLFVEIRERLSLELLTSINEVVVGHCLGWEDKHIIDRQEDEANIEEPPTGQELNESIDDGAGDDTQTKEEENKGRLIMDATVAPQHISYPTDLKLLNAAREKSEELIDVLFQPALHGKVKVRTYRQKARKDFLNTAKKKNKTAKQIYRSNGQQLRYLRRNIKHIHVLLDGYKQFPLDKRQQRYLMVLHTVYEQQKQMHDTKTKRVEHRIVNIHQPHVRPIVRGKEGKKVEFGSKLQVSLINGYTLIDHLDWEAFNESNYLKDSVNKYRERTGYYPLEVLADQIYCTKDNRAWLKKQNIKLKAKPLGRPSKKAVSNHVSPGERNPIEGKFGQAKVAYGLEKIRAKLTNTSESWIGAIALVLNLVKMAREALLCLYLELAYIIKIIIHSYKTSVFFNPLKLKTNMSF